MKKAWNAPEEYSRNLPHIHPKNATFFVTFNLAGCLPKHIIAQLQEERDYQIKQLKAQNLPKVEFNTRLGQQRNLYFGKFDHLLDNPKSGPTFLKNPEIAKMCFDAFLYFDNDRYKIICFTIMSNHVHLVLGRLDRPLFKIMHSLKLFTATEANKILDRKGNQFWQEESYDRVIRDKRELAQKITYTLNNPVKAGLCVNWKDFPFTYFRTGFEEFILDWVNISPKNPRP